MAKAVYRWGTLHRMGNPNLFSSFSSTYSDILTPTTAQIGLSLIINYIPGTGTLFCLPFKIGNYLALFISFKLGSALLTAMTNPLVRTGIS